METLSAGTVEFYMLKKNYSSVIQLFVHFLKDCINLM